MAKKVLVVCYSRGGTSMRVAGHVASALGADLERIEDGEPRTGIRGWLRSALEAVAKGLPTIRTRRDPRAYDLVVVGTPVWAGTMCSPIRAYLYAHRHELRNVAFFAVMRGRGGEDTIREMQLACDAFEAPSVVVTEREVKRGGFRATCEVLLGPLQRMIGQPDGATAPRAAA